MTQAREANVPSGPNKGDETRLKGRSGKGEKRTGFSESAKTDTRTWMGGTGTQPECARHDREIISAARVLILDRGSRKKKVGW